MTINPTIEAQARYLAASNKSLDQSIGKTFWFPHPDEVRLIFVTDEIARDPAETHVRPFYFRPAPQEGMPAPTASAIIAPDEMNALQLPDGWGDWNGAVELADSEE